MLDTLTTEQLFLILDCDKLDQINHIISAQECNKLISAQKKLELKDTNATSRSLLTAINASSNPIEILWSGISLISLGVAGLPITITLSMVALIVGIIAFCYSYQALQQRKQLAILKLVVAEKLTECLTDQIKTQLLTHSSSLEATDQIINTASENLRPYQHAATETPLKLSKLKSIGVGIAISTTLFISFVWGISDIVESVGLASMASAMTGPIGLAIAAFLIIAISSFFAYKHYQARVNSQMIKAAIAIKQDACYSLHTTLQSLTILNLSQQSDLAVQESNSPDQPWRKLPAVQFLTTLGVSFFHVRNFADNNQTDATPQPAFLPSYRN